MAAAEEPIAPIGEPAAEAAPGPTGPPANESGFPALPMFGGEIGELFNSLSPQMMVMLNSSPREGVLTNAMAMLGAESSQGTVGTTLITNHGALKAELISHGMLQASFEGFSPLPFVQLNTQLAFLPQGLAGGVLQGVMVSPIGMLMGCANTGGQLSAELLTAVQTPGEGQLMFGVHTWGVPGLRCGYKAALEFQHQLVDGEELLGSSAITLACTSPFVSADGAPLAEPERSVSLSAFHRTSKNHAVCASVDWPAKSATGGSMTLGGTRQLSDTLRLRGKWGTTGILALALEVSGEKSSVTLVAETSTLPNATAPPKFGATVVLSP